MINDVRWDITGRCNLNCKHCQAAAFYKKERLKGRKELTTEEVFQVVDKLKEAKVRRIGILGGEPMMRKDLLIILKYMYDNGFDVTLNSNLTLLNEDDIEEIFKYCQSVFVSIDGTNSVEHERLRGEETFEKTIKNIKKMVRKKGKKTVQISYVINRYNYRTTGDIYPLMKELQVDTCLVDMVHKVGNADANWEEIGLTKSQSIEAVTNLITSWDYSSDIMLVPRMYTNRFRDYLYDISGIRLDDKLVWDAPGKTSLYILSDGTLLPTHFLAYSDYEKGFISKSLKDYSINEIISEDNFAEFLRMYDKKLPKEYYEPCKTCEYCGKQCNPSPVSYWLGKKVPMEFCKV